MPWFTPLPTQDEIDLWEFKATGFFPTVSLWPKPNSARINCFFRMEHTLPPLIPVAGRYGFYLREEFLEWNPLEPETNQFGAFDWQGIGPNHIRGTFGASPEGFDVTIDLESLAGLPIINGPGVRATVVTNHPQHGTQSAVGIWDAALLANNWFYNMNTDQQLPVGDWQYENDPQWNIPRLTPQIFAVPDCYDFPRQQVGFAAFNGIDSFVSLRLGVNQLSQEFIVEADIRLHSTVFWPIFGRHNGGGFMGMNDDNLVWGSLNVDTSWVPVLEQFFHWRFEFEQQSQLNYRLLIDDELVFDQVNTRQNAVPNDLGVFRRDFPAQVIWGNFDMKNLLVLQGQAPSTIVELDMPLQANALDSGPRENHGTTFNMMLPSV